MIGSFSVESYISESDVDLLVEIENPVVWKIFSLEILFKYLYLESVIYLAFVL